MSPPLQQPPSPHLIPLHPHLPTSLRLVHLLQVIPPQLRQGSRSHAPDARHQGTATEGKGLIISSPPSSLAPVARGKCRCMQAQRGRSSRCMHAHRARAGSHMHVYKMSRVAPVSWPRRYSRTYTPPLSVPMASCASVKLTAPVSERRNFREDN
jgi:hypothetical protein